MKYFLPENKHGTHGDKCEEFVSMFQTTLDNLRKTNSHELLHVFLATNHTITTNQIEIIVNMVLQKVSNVSLAPNNLGALATLLLTVNQANSSDAFRIKLRNRSIDLFRNTFNHMQSKPTIFIDSNNLCALDKQANLIGNANFYMASYRSHRIAHFIGHLYLLDLIEAIDICSIIELCESKIDTVDMNAVTRAMAIAFRRIHLKITSADVGLASLTHTKYQMLRRTIARTKVNWIFSEKANNNCCNVEMSNDIRRILTSPWYAGIQSTVEHMNWVRFSVSEDKIKMRNSTPIRIFFSGSSILSK